MLLVSFLSFLAHIEAMCQRIATATFGGQGALLLGDGSAEITAPFEMPINTRGIVPGQSSTPLAPLWVT